jgi:hypothetical protein
LPCKQRREAYNFVDRVLEQKAASFDWQDNRPRVRTATLEVVWEALKL